MGMPIQGYKNPLAGKRRHLNLKTMLVSSEESSWTQRENEKCAVFQPTTGFRAKKNSKKHTNLTGEIG